MSPIEERLLEAVAQSPGLSIFELSTLLSISRATAAKYLEVLSARSLVKYNRRGPLKLWTLAQFSENAENNSRPQNEQLFSRLAKPVSY